MGNLSWLRLEGADYDRFGGKHLRRHNIKGDQAFHLTIVRTVSSKGEDCSGAAQVLYQLGIRNLAYLLLTWGTFVR